MNSFKLGVIGAGNMATAIIKGALKSQIVKPNEILISDINDENLKNFADLGVVTTKDNKYLSASCENLLFAVKPQIAVSVFDEIAKTITANSVISIMAGINIEKLKNALGKRNYVRIMPNTPALVGKGMSAICFDGVKNDFVLNVFNSIGETVVLEENLFDAVTSVSGSGPAYIFMFLKGMIEGGIEGGLTFDQSKKLAVQTMIGGANLLNNSEQSIDTLISNVCSKGGTTIEAVNSFKENNLVETIKTGIAKCRNRSEELSK